SPSSTSATTAAHATASRYSGSPKSTRNARSSRKGDALARRHALNQVMPPWRELPAEIAAWQRLGPDASGVMIDEFDRAPPRGRLRVEASEQLAIVERARRALGRRELRRELTGQAIVKAEPAAS